MAISKSINATEAARNFSDVLNQVKYQDTSFEIMRGRDVIARIVPIGPVRGLRVSELNALFAKLPRLAEDDVDVFERDIEESVMRLAGKEHEWD